MVIRQLDPSSELMRGQRKYLQFSPGLTQNQEQVLSNCFLIRLESTWKRGRESLELSISSSRKLLTLWRGVEDVVGESIMRDGELGTGHCGGVSEDEPSGSKARAWLKLANTTSHYIAKQAVEKVVDKLKVDKNSRLKPVLSYKGIYKIQTKKLINNK